MYYKLVQTVVYLAFVCSTLAHSWVEQVMRIAPNGTLIGPPGYMRGFVGRTDPGFMDLANTYLLPPDGRVQGRILLADDRICGRAQTIGNYSTKYPMLSAAPGDLIALRYQENGHVTLPEVCPTKPQNRGIVYIYGTSQPSNEDRLLNIHPVWSTSLQPGRQGRLLATRNFDDGQCYQLNTGPISMQRQHAVQKEAKDPQGADLWCQSDFRLPRDLATSGIYTLYWVWDWPNAGQQPAGCTARMDAPQIYTSCIDIQLVAKGTSDAVPVAFIENQDPNTRAIQGQMENDFANC